MPFGNPGTVGGTLADTTLLFGGPDTFGGAGAGTPLYEEGNIFRGVYGVATSLKPAAIAGDYVVAFYTLPANSFDIAGRGITVTAEGTFAANVNTKEAKLWVSSTLPVVGSVISGATVIGDTGAVITNGGGWFTGANVFKRGATGANTQLATSNGNISGGVHAGIVGPVDLTLVESAPIYVAVTIATTTAVGDAGLAFFEVNAMN